MQDLLQTAIAYHQQNDLQQAELHYRKILLDHPDAAHVHYLLAAALSSHNATEEAKEHLIEAVTKGDPNPHYHGLLGHVLKDLKDHHGALYQYRRALQLDPSYTEAHHGIIDMLIETEQYKTARDTLSDSLASNPEQPNLWSKLASIWVSLNEANKAVESANNALTRDPNQELAFLSRGRALILLKRNQEALSDLQQALNLKPQNPQAHYFLGLLHYKNNHKRPALQAFKTALEQDPAFLEARTQLAVASAEQTLTEDALKHAEIVLEKEPKNPQALYAKGKALLQKFDEQKAIVCLQKAIVQKNNYVECYMELGILFRKKGNLQKSEETYLKALEHSDNQDGIYSALSYVYNEQSKTGTPEAMEKSWHAISKALGNKPESSWSQLMISNYYMAAGLPHLAVPHFKRSHELSNIATPGLSSYLFNSNYAYHLKDEELFNIHTDWAEKSLKITPSENQNYPNTPDPAKRLRIGYVSADFSTHPVAYFFKPILDAHNPENVETFLFYNSKKKDGFNTYFREHANHFIDIHGKDDNTVEALIKENEIDILVEMSGHSSGHRLPLFARKPAPVSVTWLGYPNTTGLTAIDYRFSDEICEPPGHCDTISTEKIYRLPNGFHCYWMPYKFPDITELPALKNDYITFGTFNNCCKLNPTFTRVWAQILTRVPNSRLLLKDRYFTQSVTLQTYRNIFREYGIDDERVTFQGFTKGNKTHLENYAHLDIALDTYPYNGTTTTCEALLNGAPVITLAGTRHCSRVTASLLTRVGMADWVANTEEDYIQIAENKASDIEELAKTRKNLRERFENSPLHDNKLIASDLENAYRDMWQQWCSRNKTNPEKS